MHLVYFLHDVEIDAIKVGSTRELAERLSVHVQSARSGLRFMGVMPGDQVRERKVHRTFAHLRLTHQWRGSSYRAPRVELFLPQPELLRFVDRLPIRDLRAALDASDDGCPCWRCVQARDRVLDKLTRTDRLMRAS